MRKVDLWGVIPTLELSGNLIIVGSSDKLKDSGLGEVIDSHDEVVRFNRAPTENFENDVGKKTTLRIANNHVFSNVDISNRGFSQQPANFIRELKNQRILYIGPHIGPWHQRKKNCHPTSRAYLFRYEVVPKIKKELGLNSSKQLTVGATIIGLCITSGVVPTIAGFDIETTTRTHYWEKRPSKPGPTHDVSAEQEWLRSLYRDGKIIILGES